MRLTIQTDIQRNGAGQLWRIRGDEELAEHNFMSRTASESWGWGPQTPSVFRYFPVPREEAGDFRVRMSPMQAVLCVLNGETQLTDPKTAYLVSPITAIYNNTGWDRQAYITMSRNLLKGMAVGNFLEFETLTPFSNVTGMTYASHPFFIHKFDIVGITAGSVTYHTWNTPRGEIYYFLVTNEGKAYIPLKYVARV